MKNISLFIFILIIKFHFSQTSISSLIIGHWKNCGEFNIRTKVITLYKNRIDSCNNFENSCTKSNWFFIQDSTKEYLGVSSILNIEIKSSCKNKEKPKQSNSIVKDGPIAWYVDENNKLLFLTYGKERYVYKILKLNDSVIDLNYVQY